MTNVNKFIQYCIEMKSPAQLYEQFYYSMSIDAKECRRFDITGDEWRYAIRIALKKKGGYKNSFNIGECNA